MHWTVACVKSNGQLRGQFSQWAIPIVIRRALGIEDGLQLSVSVTHLLYHETLDLKVTSGGEIRLPKVLSDVISAQAKATPASTVTFTINLDDESASDAAKFEERVNASLRLGSETRRARLKHAPRTPSARKVETIIFDRNPDVVAEVLDRAGGYCERCGSSAPFIRKSNGTPYLEVHHKIQLAKGGDDTVSNSQALCPNCHRELHHGQLG